MRCQKVKRSVQHLNSCIQSSPVYLTVRHQIKISCWLQMLYPTCVTRTGAKGTTVGTRCRLFKTCSQCFNGVSHSIRNKRTWTCFDHRKQGSVLHMTSPVAFQKQSYVVVELKYLIQSLHYLVCCGVSYFSMTLIIGFSQKRLPLMTTALFLLCKSGRIKMSVPCLHLNFQMLLILPVESNH